MAQESDHMLLAQLRDSDQDALCTLYLRYAPAVRLFAFKLLKDQSDAEDITQDVFLRLWNAREILPEIDALRPYLLRMTRNSVLNLLRSRKARGAYVEFSMKFHSGAEPEKVTAEDLLRVIDGELMELPDNQRAAFAMSRYDGKTYDEISSSLGISRKTVQYHISRVLERLRNLLK